nr:non-ribosomal peptide synthetase [Tistrella bauzanensis]
MADAAPCFADGDGPAGLRHDWALDAAETRLLTEDLPRRLRIGVDDLLVAALAMAVGGVTGAERVLIDLEGHGRDLEISAPGLTGLDVSRTVGWFTSRYPVAIAVGGEWAAVLADTRQRLRAVPDHGIRFGMLPADAQAAMPVADIGFNYLGRIDLGVAAGDCFTLAGEAPGRSIAEGLRFSDHKLAVDAKISGGRLSVSWRSDGAVADDAALAGLSDRFATALRALIDHGLHGRPLAVPADFPLAGLDAPALARLDVALDAVEDIYPATALQQGLLFHSAGDGTGLYLNQLHLTLEPDADCARLVAAWERAVDRHPILRTGFDWRHGGSAMQVVRRRAGLPVRHHHWQAADQSAHDHRLVAWCAEDRAAGIDVTTAPLMRLALFSRPDGGHDLIWTSHHALSDGWSLARFMAEIVADYDATSRDEAPVLPPVPPYRDYVAWTQRQPDPEPWWRAQIARVDEPARLGSWITGPADRQGSFTLETPLDAAQTERLRVVAAAANVTVNTLVQGAWALLLARFGARDQVVFGVTVSGRPADLPGADRMLGLFINSLPLWVDLDPARRLDDWLRDLQAMNGALRAVEATPLGAVQRWSGLSGDALFDSLLVFENYPVEAGLRSSGLGAVTRRVAMAERTHYPLTLAAIPGDRLELRWGIDGSRIDRQTAGDIARDFVDLLDRMPAMMTGQGLMTGRGLMTGQALGGIGLRSAAGAILGGALPASAAFRPVTSQISAQALRRPAATALVCEGRAIGYATLDAWANRIAQALLDRGTPGEARPEDRREDRVGLAVTRGPAMVAGLLGIMKAGATVVPMDPDYPAARLADMLDDANIRRIVADDASRRRLAAVLGDRLVINPEAAVDLVSEAVPAIDRVMHPVGLAYVIHTSGSTGRPKGVAVPHGALALHVDAYADRMGLTDADRVLQLSTVNFDAAFEQLLPVLCRGGTVVLRGPAMWEFATLNTRLANDRVTLAYLPTGYWRQWLRTLPADLAAGLPDLRLVTVGGEALAGDALAAWRAGPLGHLPFLNTYGPTEATITATGHAPAQADDALAAVPIGRPWPGRHLLVVDASGNPVPAGAVGELCIGGDALARGYHGRPGLTAERFVPDDSGPVGGRLYRTGDLVRLGRDGVIGFLGRIDAQIKLRGFRIETGEIEAVLRAVDGVRDAVAGLTGPADSRRLVAHVAGDAGVETLTAALAARLPEHMRPQAIMVMDALPLLPNGKIDRKALPEPDVMPAAVVAPRTPTEQTLLDIWQAVLGRRDFGVTDSFFDLGGDSILSLQLVARAREAGLAVTPRQVFAHPQIDGLAMVVQPLDPVVGHAIAQDFSDLRAVLADLGENFQAIDDVYPATPLQQGLLFHARIGARDGLYVNQLRLTIDGALDPDALEAAWQAAIDRHPVLRTRFEWRHGGDALQVVQRRAALVIGRDDWMAADVVEHDTRLAAWCAEDVARGFDLTRAPLMRLNLFQRPDGGQDLVWTMHHVITDGWSTARLLREIATDYAARLTGGTADLPVPPPYRDYVAWLAAQPSPEGWWRAQAARIADPATLTAALAPADPSAGLPDDGDDDLRVVLDADVSGRLVALARRAGVTLNTVVQGAWALLLARLGGRDQVAFGVTVAGRPAGLAGAEAMQGLFINSLPLFVDLPASISLGDWLRDLQGLNAYLRQYEQSSLADVQRWTGRSGDALFDSLVVFENYPVDAGLAAMAFGGRLRASETIERTHYPLTLSVAPGETIALGFGYDPARLDAARVAWLARGFGQLLDRMGAGDDPAIGAIALAHDLKPAQVPVVAPFRDVVGRIAMAAAARPDAVAVACEGHMLRYGALQAVSGAVARRLLAEGLAADDVVGLCVGRGPALVAGFVGILAGGGAVLALDPDLPDTRLQDMLDDAGVRLLVVDEAGGARLAALAAGRLLVAIAAAAAGDGGDTSLPVLPAPLPAQLAYVIYTSGSTGRPKGVGVAHGALAVHVDDYIDRFGLTLDDRVLQLSTLGFDAAVEQILPALTVGARVVMRGADLWSPEQVTRRLRDDGVTLAYLPTGYWRAWQTAVTGPLPALRQVATGGEALPGAALDAWFAGPLASVPFDNTYGPTEAVVTVSGHRVRPGDAMAVAVAIGAIWPGRVARILDAHGNDVPDGGQGELCLGGPALARGYLGRAGLTAERFVPDEAGTPGARLYRSGDLARRRADGTIDFLGRMDGQIKLRGFRIEPGEVEAAMRRHAGVADAVVVLTGAETPRLVGYVTGSADPAAVKAALATQLPAHMVPQAIMALPALPLTPAGKLDWRALPDPDPAPVAAALPPRDVMEARLLAVWQAVLGRADFGVSDDFFDLGGDSILSLQLVSRARKAGLVLTPRQVFEHPRIQEQAAVAGLAGGVDTATEVTGRDLPLTPIQAGFFERYPEGPSHWNQAVLLAVTGVLDDAALAIALAAVVCRHDALRLRFTIGDDRRWSQRVVPAADAEACDLLIVREIDDDPATLDAAGDAVQASLDIGHGPVLRAGLFRRAGGDRLLIAIHHLAVDGVSWRVLLGDLEQAYAAAASGREPALAPVGTPWSRWVLAQRRYGEAPALTQELGWWQNQLSGAVAVLPDTRSGESLQHDWLLDETTTARLINDVPRRYRIGVDEVLLASLVRTLGDAHGLAAGTRLLIGLEGHGREDVIDGVDLSRTVGWFTTRFTIAPAVAGPPEALLSGVKASLRAVPQKGLHPGLLRLSDDPEIAAAARALPEAAVGFNYLGRFDEAGSGDMSGAAASRFSFTREAAGRAVVSTSGMAHGLELNAMVAGGRLSVSWRHDTGVLDRADVAALAAAFGRHLTALIDHCLTHDPKATPQDFDIDIDQDALDDLLAEIDG